MLFGEGRWKTWQEDAVVLPGRGEVKGRPAVGNQSGKLLLCHFRIGNLQLGDTFFLSCQLEALGKVVMFLEAKQIHLSYFSPEFWILPQEV